MWWLSIPYIVLIAVYIFVSKIHRSRPPYGGKLSAILKCLPIIYLLVLLRVTPTIGPDHANYKMFMSLAFLFSLGGDICLHWIKSLFLPGIGCFALAQAAYTLAFGFDPIGHGTAITFMVIAVLVMLVLLPYVKPAHLTPFVTLYVSLLCTVGWRATTRYEDRRTWDTALGMAGAFFFIISDFAIGFNQWRKRIPRAMLFIMVTYYIAQILFTLSVLAPIMNKRNTIKAVYRGMM